MFGMAAFRVLVRAFRMGWQTHNLLDYQGLLLDCRKPSRIAQPQLLTKLLLEFMKNGHSVFVILPEARDLPDGGMPFDILPFVRLNVRGQKGKTLRQSINTPIFQDYAKALNGHEIVIDPQPMRAPNQPNWHFQTAISDNVNTAVCGIYASALVFHPPALGRDDLMVKAILQHFKPDFEEPEPEEPPEWSRQVASQIPGVAEITARRTQTSQDIARLQSILDADELKQNELEKWTEMLWLAGIPLQTRVSEALALLGIPNESRNPTGHMEDLQGTCMGKPFLFEVTGSTGSIGVEKARQLLQWVGECADPANTKGVLIGNAYRNDPPERRPPSPDHKIFVREVDEMAHRFHFAVVEVRDLFSLVVKKLRGEDIKPEAFCEALQADGQVRFDKL
ncbi:MAG: hypothetical protein WB680_16765 [Candidatus Acidiferrales bacterium]